MHVFITLFPHDVFASMFKVPLLWVMKGSYFGFGRYRLTCTQGQKTLSLSYNMHLFFTLLCSTTPKRFTQWFIFPNPPLHDVDQCWLVDRSHFHLISPVMPDKAAFVSAVLLCVQRYRGNRYFTALKDAPSGKELIIIFIQTNEKIPTSGQEIWLCFMLTSTAVSMIQSRNNNFIQGLLSDVKLYRMFSFT